MGHQVPRDLSLTSAGNLHQHSGGLPHPVPEFGRWVPQISMVECDKSDVALFSDGGSRCRLVSLVWIFRCAVRMGPRQNLKSRIELDHRRREFFQDAEVTRCLAIPVADLFFERRNAHHGLLQIAPIDRQS